MEEERKKGKEYYRVNLDTGRIFWITFLLGILLIGIFILGLYIGSGREKKGFFSIRKDQLTKKEEVAEEEIPLKDLFENNLEAETRYIEVEGMEEAVTKVEKEALKATPETEKGVTVTEKKVTGEIKEPEIKKPYIAKGDYYIQVASSLNRENAEKFAKKLEKGMYRVKIEEALVDGKTYYRVRVGPFETKSIASNTMIAMKKQFGIKDGKKEPYVVKKTR